MGYAGKRRAEGVGDNGKAKRRKGQDSDDNIIDLVGATGQGELSSSHDHELMLPLTMLQLTIGVNSSCVRLRAFQSPTCLAPIHPFLTFLTFRPCVCPCMIFSDGWGVSGGRGEPDDQPSQGTRQDRLRLLLPAQVHSHTP